MDTYEAKIYLGLRSGYSDLHHSIAEVESLAQKYVDLVSLCVTVTETKFIYKNGWERGAIIGLINYPRFPKMEIEIKETALDLAQILKDKFGQNRVSVVCTDETIMLGDSE